MLPNPGSRRAIVVGAGSFGTATAVLLARGGFRTTLQTRSADQAARLTADRENKTYLEGVELPRDLRIAPVSSTPPGRRRGTSSSRCGATPSTRGRARSR